VFALESAKTVRDVTSTSLLGKYSGLLNLKVPFGHKVALPTKKPGSLEETIVTANQSAVEIFLPLHIKPNLKSTLVRV